MIWALAVVLMIVLALALWPVVADMRRQPMNDAARKNAPGSTARLPQGVTYYRWFGPTRGPVIVAIHGLTTPSEALVPLAERMGRLGFRTLVYDLYGRGRSAAPRGRQTPAFFVRQLTDLLQDQGLDDNLTLMGYSMGGAIATHFAAAQPHRVNRVILLASAGSGIAESRFLRFCRQTPLLGDWVFHMFAPAQMARAIADSGVSAQMQAVQHKQLARRRFLSAVLSSQRHTLHVPTTEEHRTIGREWISTIAIWGDADPVIPIQALGEVARWNRNARQHVIEGGDHAFPYERADAVFDVLRDILREPDHAG